MKLYDKDINRGAALCAPLLPFLVFLAVYVPAAGHGFISDDFHWVLQSRVRTLDDLWRVVRTDNGFYRPVVSLSFTVNEWMFGSGPRPYGLVNVALAGGCGVVLYALCRALRLSAAAGLFAAALWLLSLHGVGGAILWISGRTALLVSLGAGAAAVSLLRGNDWAVLVWTAIAVFAKEEAVALPVILAAWAMIRDGRQGVARSRWAIAGSLGVLGVYLAARSTTGAMTPLSAPSYYRFAHEPATILRNVLEYADRVGTMPLAAVLLGCGLLQAWPRRFSADQRRTLWCLGTWVAGTFAITVMIPARSSLYVCLPGIGVCVAAALAIEQAWHRATAAGRRRAVVWAAIVPLALAPVLYGRTRRLKALAEFSTTTLHDIVRATDGLPEGSTVIVEDGPDRRANVDVAFGNLLGDAVTLSSGRRLEFVVQPSNEPARGCGGCEALRLYLRDGRITR